MNAHQAACAVIENALFAALAQAYGDVPPAMRHDLAEQLCEQIETWRAQQGREAGDLSGGAS